MFQPSGHRQNSDDSFHQEYEPDPDFENEGALSLLFILLFPLKRQRFPFL